MSANETAVEAAAKKLSDVMGAGEDWSPLARAAVIAFLRVEWAATVRVTPRWFVIDGLIRELEDGK